MITSLPAILFTMTTLPQGPTPTPEATAALATTHLGIELFRTLGHAAPGTNLFVSPDSVTTALAIVMAGAREQTLAEMKRALGLPADTPDAALHAGLQRLQQRLEAGRGTGTDAQRAEVAALRTQLATLNQRAEQLADGGKDWQAARAAQQEAEQVAALLNRQLQGLDRYELSCANALWVDRSFPILADYVATIDRWYGSGAAQQLDFAHDPDGAAQQLDFAHDPDGAARTINDWVAARTNDRIRDLLAKGSVPAATPMIVTNTIWFRGEWQQPFDAARTQPQPFLLAAGGEVSVPLMRDGHRHGVPYAAFDGDGDLFATPHEVPGEPGARQPPTYPDDRGFQMVELPYKGGELAMVVLVPQSRDGLPQLERLLTAERLHGWLTKLGARQVDTSLPRFRLDGDHELAPALQALGMHRAFTSPEQPDGAQFAGISSSTDPRQQVCISRVVHKTMLDVSEKGTEAAAATAVLMAVGAAARPLRMVPFHPVVRADRPFLFLIRDVKTSALLFLGRYVDPRR
ncbi:MAG: serpin family protein [Planctomycetes bacterium]|nr:serpin family protein [Planctomycetota bacterium]